MPIERRTGVCTVANVGAIRKPSVLPSRNRVVGSEKRDSERIVGNPELIQMLSRQIGNEKS